jgi:multidrug efflux pump subunit AcrB
MSFKTDSEFIEKTHNTARFFSEHRQVAWVLLLGTVMWGAYGYFSMPQRKDPDISVPVAVATCQWPGVGAEEVEHLVTRKIEQAIALNSRIRPGSASDFGIRSLTLPGLSIVYVMLDEGISKPKEQFSDINLKLNALNSRLPDGAGPIQFQSDYADTAALMLTVASPPVDDTEIALRARTLERAVREVRAARGGNSRADNISIAYCFPPTIAQEAAARTFNLIARVMEKEGVFRDLRLINGPGFIGLDAFSTLDDAALEVYARNLMRERLHLSEIHPDGWGPVVVHDPAGINTQLAQAAGDKYSYQELDDYTDLIARTVLGAPQASKADRSGVLPQVIYLVYSQERLAAYNLQAAQLKDILGARNIALPGGTLEVGQKNLVIDPSGQFTSERAIGDVIVGASSSGSPIYLRDLVDIVRAYQSPPQFLNFYTWADSSGKWHRSRAVTLAIYMRSGEQIANFGRNVDEKLAAVRQLLPKDLIIARTSDQPRQVEENIDLFMDALYEAIALVVLISLVGFWEWRSALLMALSIPITLAMTFGLANVLRIDLQQVSIATLIIALGLLVDDPVVAGDGIKRGLAAGHPRVIAAWLEPTRLGKAIMYATVTNIVAYLPFLLLTGNSGDFLYSLPIVMTCALVSSRIVSMTFIPLLGYYLLRPRRKPEPSVEERRTRGFTGAYNRVAAFAIEHRWLVLTSSLLFLALGAFLASRLKKQFFPDDLQYWSYIDVRLPNDAPLSATNEAARRVEDVVRETISRYGRSRPDSKGRESELLKSLTTFIGSGGPRFWFSVSPELPQANYAQIIIQVSDKEDTPKLVGLLQTTLATSIAGAQVDVHQLQTNPVDYPVQVFLSAQADVFSNASEQDIRTLRRLAGQVEDILRSSPKAGSARNDWGEESSEVRLQIDPDRANLAGVTNLDVARSSTMAMSGMPVTVLREGVRQIPVVARLRMEERARLSDIQNLYVYTPGGKAKVPLLQISSVLNTMATQRIRRQDHFRTISVHCFPAPGALASEVLDPVLPALAAFEKTLPPGYKMVIGGERAKQQQNFRKLAVIMAISVVLIFVALVMQFNHAVKPFLVFAAVPYGMVGALIALTVMGVPFGFMAFLGVASLVGVIVSHVIVLFDFIEEMHEKGEPFQQALIDAGIMRLRPVLITVGATVLALFPLALHGGPLWQPLCYAQIGGLTVATFITLLLVPVFYSIFVLDLKIVRWDENRAPSGAHSTTTEPTELG